jgi:hypothetical protein
MTSPRIAKSLCAGEDKSEKGRESSMMKTKGPKNNPMVFRHLSNLISAELSFSSMMI